MSFQQKRALVSLVTIWVATVWYGVSVWRSPPTTPAGAAPMLVAAAIGLTVMMTCAHILLMVGAGAEEARRPADQTDRYVRTAAWRNAGWIMAGGLFLIIGLGLISAPPVLLMQAALAAFVLAEMVRYGSELLYRRGAA